MTKDHVIFTYSFEKDLHDQFIETDTECKSVLGQGLDIFLKALGKFTQDCRPDGGARRQRQLSL
ncbi:MAG: hypothetical protein DRN08_05005 [Thermoplasmata archaeon]|nr:MAG: hypothetical protein DRN08_05005 [Thermoplasmata archaeon]